MSTRTHSTLGHAASRDEEERYQGRRKLREREARHRAFEWEKATKSWSYHTPFFLDAVSSRPVYQCTDTDVDSYERKTLTMEAALNEYNTEMDSKALLKIDFDGDANDANLLSMFTFDPSIKKLEPIIADDAKHKNIERSTALLRTAAFRLGPTNELFYNLMRDLTLKAYLGMLDVTETLKLPVYEDAYNEIINEARLQFPGKEDLRTVLNHFDPGWQPVDYDSVEPEPFFFDEGEDKDSDYNTEHLPTLINWKIPVLQSVMHAVFEVARTTPRMTDEQHRALIDLANLITKLTKQCTRTLDIMVTSIHMDAIVVGGAHVMHKLRSMNLNDDNLIGEIGEFLFGDPRRRNNDEPD